MANSLLIRGGLIILEVLVIDGILTFLQGYRAGRLEMLDRIQQARGQRR
jgi:hypothetical protein